MKRKHSKRRSEITEEKTPKKSKPKVSQESENKLDLAEILDKKQSQSHDCVPNSGSCDPKKLVDDFYNIPCEKLANSLLGKVLVRRLDDGTILRGRIVETESYPGGDDKGSVTCNGRKTPKTEPLFMAPGTTWVYLTYGMYHCINISSQGAGAAVLLRAVDPLEGFDHMNKQRLSNRKVKKDIKLKDYELCNGPSKLCMSFSIGIPTCNKINLCSSEDLWIEDDGIDVGPDEIITTTRIGIESVGKEWAMKPYRYYVYGSNSVSKRDPRKESCKDLK